MDILTATKVFVTVAELGSFGQAAEHLGITAAMATRHVASLESWLSVRLLHRTTRRLSLTEAGVAALPYAIDLIEEGTVLEARAAAMQNVPRGALHISASHLFAEERLIAAVAAFQARYPEIVITLAASDTPPDDLTTDRIDLLVFTSLNGLPANAVKKKIYTSTLIFCASGAYLDNNAPLEKWTDFTNHRFIHHTLFDTLPLNYFVSGQRVDLKLPSVFSCNDTRVVRRAALSGLGVALLPDYSVENEILSGDLVRIPVDLDSIKFEICLAHQNDISHSRPLQLFLDFISEIFGSDE